MSIDLLRQFGSAIPLDALPPETVFNIFEVLGFTHLYSIFDTEDKAIRSFEEKPN